MTGAKRIRVLLLCLLLLCSLSMTTFGLDSAVSAGTDGILLQAVLQRPFAGLVPSHAETFLLPQYRESLAEKNQDQGQRSKMLFWSGLAPDVLTDGRYALSSDRILNFGIFSARIALFYTLHGQDGMK